MEILVLVALTVLAAGLLFTAAAATKSLREFSRSELEEVCEDQELPDRYDAILQRHEPVALACELLQNVAVVLFIWTLFSLVRSTATLVGWEIAALEFAVGVGLVVLLQSWLPWTLVRLGPERFLVNTWPLWYTVGLIFRPVIVLARLVDGIVFWLAGREQKKLSDESFEDELLAVVDDGQRDGYLPEQTAEMIEGVIEMREVQVQEVMTPRPDMVCIQYDATLEEALDLVRTSGHTRFPAYGKDRDDIRGILHARDLLIALAPKKSDRNGRPTRVRDITQEAVFVPETKTIDVLLAEFRTNRKHMAIVSDEFGGVAGLVTIENILEEIVGDIVDEHDRELESDSDYLTNPDGSYEVSGRMHIDELNDELDLDIPTSDDYDTIGGLVFNTLGHMPQVNEQVIVGESRITVLSVDRRRVDRVRITALDPSAVPSQTQQESP